MARVPLTRLQKALIRLDTDLRALGLKWALVGGFAVMGASERFGPVGLAREVNERFGERLRRPVTVPQISIVLRRLHDQGKIHQVRQGRPHWEALYVKEEPAG